MSQLPTPDKPLPIIPQPSMSTLSLSSDDDDEGSNDVTPLPSTESSDQGCPTDITKRDYALLELLDSERTYASDLILIRNYQIPLASGRLSSISSIWPVSDSESTIRRYPGLELPTPDIPAIPPRSSAVPPRPLTRASEASAMSFDSIFTLRPMKTKDISIVFGNIEELAIFSEVFLDNLESALGELIEGNEGEDYVGKFFLDFIPQMEPLYRAYTMNQSQALEHYHRLSKTFQFDVYFPRSQILAHKSSNAWDLPSLLIKPVQRLLHYPQLLAAILSETPDSHGDKETLFEAHARMETLARDLNARWRQQKVVREVLAGAGSVGGRGDGARAKKRGGLKASLAASVNLGRIMGVRQGALKAKEGPEANGEAEAVAAMGARLKCCESFMAQLVGAAVDWVDAMRTTLGALDDWAHGFSKVIWMDPAEGCSDTFKAFLFVRDELLAACDTLETEIKEDVLRTIESLQATMVNPVRLLEAMQTLEPLHLSPLNLNPMASESYVALRAQLFVELPKYLTLLDRGMAACILKLAHVQQRFYDNVRDKWAELRDHVGVDGDTNEDAGAGETFREWRKRFIDVDEQLTRLNIVRHPGEKPPLVKQRIESDDQYVASNESGGEATSSAALASFLATLQQSRVPTPAVRGPSPPPSGTKRRSVHSISSSERLHPEQSEKSDGSGGPSSSPYDVSWAALAPTPPALHSRRRIIPVPPPPGRSHSPRTYLDVDEWITSSGSNHWQGADGASGAIQEDDRGQRPRRPSPLRWPPHAVTPSPAPDIGDLHSQEGAGLAKDTKSRPQVARSGVPSRTAAVYEVANDNNSDSDDSDISVTATAGLSHWSMQTITLQKPVVKPNTPQANRGGRAAMTTSAYARGAAANAKFGTRLISSDSHRAIRPGSRRTVAPPVNRKVQVTPHPDEGHSAHVATTRRRRPLNSSTL